MNLDKYLKNNGLKKDFFSKQLGITRTTLYRYMKGNKKIPLYIKLAVAKLTNGEVDEISCGRGANTLAKSKKSKKHLL